MAEPLTPIEEEILRYVEMETQFEETIPTLDEVTIVEIQMFEEDQPFEEVVLVEM
tara:strand:+ start:83050 stop:83214 length:165 start_codon:yes stop_codon:yes gene_type:complete